MPSIKASDLYAEETLIGLLLTGDAEVYRFAVEIRPLADFEEPALRLACKSLAPFFDFLRDTDYADDIPVSDIAEQLERQELTGFGKSALPLSWFADLAEKAVARTNAAIDKLQSHSVPLTLRESVSILVCKVKLAAANRADSRSGAAVLEEMFLLETDRLTPTEIVASLMQSGGAGAEYLGRFREPARSWVVSVLLETAGERVGVVA